MNINYPVLRKTQELGGVNRPNKIILHHPEWKGTPEDLNEMMISMGYSMCGYNFYVRMDGSVYAMRPVSVLSANCTGQNTCSIGVCCEGNFDFDTMPEVQKNSTIELCKYLRGHYPAIQEIGPHKKYFNTACPGTNFPVTEIISAVMGAYVQPVGAQQNNSILDLQKALNRLQIRDQRGDKLTEDGANGSCTITAVKRFQFLVGLDPDGITGANTWDAFNQILEKPVCSINQKPAASVIRYLQYRMVTGVDGSWGNGTDTAIKAYQQGKGLAADGIVGNQTWSILIG